MTELSRDEFERWAAGFKLSDPQTLEVVYPLANNLWTLARHLEKFNQEPGDDGNIDDFSTTASGE